ncbi:MAG: hypothetical protein P8Z30_00970 [Acidobacteriota bacterium]
MAPNSEFRKPAEPRAQQQTGDHTHPGVWSKVKLVAKRAIFWSYERGSWQYDIIVLLILAFIFLSPASWFHDRPRLQLSDLRHVPGIVEVSHTDNAWVYQLDARLVESLGQVPPDKAFHQLLLQRIKPPFVIKSVHPILGKGNIILGYTVVVGR